MESSRLRRTVHPSWFSPRVFKLLDVVVIQIVETHPVDEPAAAHRGDDHQQEQFAKGKLGEFHRRSFGGSYGFEGMG
jgi:hypothetical protein